MRLRNEVKKDDIDFAIRTMLHSFISTQKYNTATQMKKKFQAFM